jgi:hypothetical protein
MSDYPNTGGLWKTKEKKYEKSPDMWGELKLDRDYVRQLLEDSNGLVTIKLSVWNKVSGNGSNWMAMKVDTWKPDNKQEERMPEL